MWLQRHGGQTVEVPFELRSELFVKQDQKDLLNLPLCKVMNCYINCSHCEGQNLTEFQSGRLASTDLNWPKPWSWVMNCYGCVHCEGQNTTEFQPSIMAVVVLPQLASTCLNRELRSSNRVKPSWLGLNMPQPQVEFIKLFTTSWGHKNIYKLRS